MCRPPAKRSIEATSALRQQVLVIWVFASSLFTCAVIAMGRSSHASQSPSADDPGVGRGQLERVVAGGPRRLGDVGDDQLGAVGGDDVLQLRQLLAAEVL